MNNKVKALRNILQSTEFIMADIGARDGVSSNWSELSELIKFVLFEPDVDEAKKLTSITGVNNVVVPMAVWDVSGMHPLYVTQHPWLCSMLKPNEVVLTGTARHDLGMYEIERTVEIEADTLGNILDKNKVSALDYIKVDVQGGEMHVLNSITDKAWENVLGIKTESYCCELYEGATQISDVMGMLYDKGFELFDVIDHEKLYISSYLGEKFSNKNLFGCHHTIGQKGRSMVFDLMMFRPPSWYFEKKDLSSELLRKGIFLYSFFGYFDSALLLVLRGKERGILTDEDAGKMTQVIKRLHRQGLSFRDIIKIFVSKTPLKIIFRLHRKVMNLLR